jgi:hypothetical protein
VKGGKGQKEEPRTSEPPRKEPKVLSAREALSLISTAPLSTFGVEDMTVLDTDRLPDTHEDASGGGEESLTSEERSDHLGRTDSAASQT